MYCRLRKRPLGVRLRDFVGILEFYLLSGFGCRMASLLAAFFLLDESLWRVFGGFSSVIRGWHLFSQWLEEKILSLNNLSCLNWFWDQGNVDQHYDCFDFFLAIFLRMSTLNLRLAECNTWNLKELRNESNVISNVTWWVILRQLHET